jgi:hypothetical protein
MPAAQSGLASGIASTSRQVGQALGVAVTGALLNADLRGPMRTAFAEGSRTAWWVLTGCGCVVLVLGLAAILAHEPLIPGDTMSGVDRPTQPIPRIPMETRPSRPVEWTPTPGPRGGQSPWALMSFRGQPVG